MSRPDQVLLDVKRRQPVRWVAVDDCPDDWSSWTGIHAVRTDAVLGLAEKISLNILRTRLAKEFLI
jgi:hypothetical protein